MNKNEELIVNSTTLREGKRVLSCTQAHKLLEQHNISLQEIGETCNQHGIKIIQCQLGCFE